MKKSVRWWVLAAIGLLLLLAGCSRIVQDGTQINVLSNGEALHVDAAEYAEDQNVSIDEAIRRLELQGDIGKLDAELTTKEPDTYAGLWIQHKPEFGVIVNMTESAEKVSDYTKGTSLAELTEIRKATKSLKQLEADQNLTNDVLHTLKLPFESGINVFENRAELYVLDEEQLSATKDYR